MYKVWRKPLLLEALDHRRDTRKQLDRVLHKIPKEKPSLISKNPGGYIPTTHNTAGTPSTSQSVCTASMQPLKNTLLLFCHPPLAQLPKNLLNYTPKTIYTLHMERSMEMTQHDFQFETEWSCVLHQHSIILMARVYIVGFDSVRLILSFIL